MILIQTSEKMMENEAINWYAVELFLTVCDAGGITAAVRSGLAGISQPALSAQMQALEDEVGHALFERKPFRLTNEGQLFRSEFEMVRRRMRESLDKVKKSNQGILRIAASDVVISKHLPKLLEAMNFPKSARLHLLDASSHQLPNLVRDGEVDVAIGVMSSHANKGRLPLAETLIEVPVGVIRPKEKRRSCPSWQELKQTLQGSDVPGLIGLPAQNLISDHVISSLRKKGIVWPISMEVSSLSHVANFVSLGLGYGIHLAPAMDEKQVRQLDWIEFPANIVPPLAIGMWYGEHPNDLARSFLQVARNYARAIRPQ
jgi:DNA-binding transcriptional LysR family regulator